MTDALFRPCTHVERYFLKRSPLCFGPMSTCKQYFIWLKLGGLLNFKVKMLKVFSQCLSGWAETEICLEMMKQTAILICVGFIIGKCQPEVCVDIFSIRVGMLP